MRVITVNLPLDNLEAIDLLTGNQGLYPSRSELIRVAIRDFLLQSVKLTQTKSIPKPPEPEPNTNFVYVPTVDGSPIYKTYRIVPRLTQRSI